MLSAKHIVVLKSFKDTPNNSLFPGIETFDTCLIFRSSQSIRESMKYKEQNHEVTSR